MTGKEILLRAIQNQETPRPAWVPFVGVHGGHLIGAPATDYLQSADLLVKGLKKSIELYRPDGIPVAFDLQLEAEILGCSLHWAEEVPPAVISHPLTTMKLEELPGIDGNKGRFPIVLEALDRLTPRTADTVHIFYVRRGQKSLDEILYNVVIIFYPIFA